MIDDLERANVLRPTDRILFREARLTRFANVIYDFERASALSEVQGHLHETGVRACGRYGDWSHAWTDEAFASGEQAAEDVLAGEISAP